MGAGADPCTPAPLHPCARFYFCCALLLFSNKGEETEPEHFMCSKNFFIPRNEKQNKF